MSEQEVKLTDRLLKGIRDAQRRMVERKAKLGEPVVIADADGKPKYISAEEAKKLYR